MFFGSALPAGSEFVDPYIESALVVSGGGWRVSFKPFILEVVESWSRARSLFAPWKPLRISTPSLRTIALRELMDIVKFEFARDREQKQNSTRSIVRGSASLSSPSGILDAR